MSLLWWIILKLKNKGVDSENRFTLIMLDMFGATLFGSVYKLPTIRALRFLVISYILYCIHIQTLFSSKLLQSLTVPQYERGIKNIDDVFHSNLQVFASPQLRFVIGVPYENDGIYNQMHKSLKYMLPNVCYCIKEYQCVVIITGHEYFLNAAFFEVSNTFTDTTFTGNWYYAFHSLKWSYFTTTLEKITYILFESGITNDFGKRSMIDDSKTVVESRQVVLTFNHVYIVLVFLFAGLLLSLFAFFIELFVNNCIEYKWLSRHVGKYSNKSDKSLRLHTGNPQETLNDCGKVVNMINEQNCKTKFRFEFPQVLRKYTNCIIIDATNQVIYDRHVPYIKSQVLTDLIISRLNSSSTGTDIDKKFFIELKLIRMSEYYKSSSSIIYSGMALWLVPKPRPMSTLKVITVIFQKILWICILFSFCVISLVWWIILKLKNKGVDSKSGFTLLMLDMWGATLFGSVYKLSTLGSLRFLVISYIMYCIHIQALFTSKLLQSLTVPQYERAITSLEDVFHSNLQVFASTQVRRAMSNAYENNSIYYQMYKSLKRVLPEIDVYHCIKEHQCVAVLTGQEYYLDADFFEVSNKFIDNTFTGNWHYAFHSLKSSYFTTTLGKIMYIVFESGITNDFGQRSTIDDSKTVVKCRQVVLTVDHVYIVFVFLFVGFLLSLFTFFIELFVNIVGIGYKRLNRHGPPREPDVFNMYSTKPLYFVE
ncbi:hypothetical protein FQR65_LT01527 [Abscondita terminalis]|nr:hypothetical protein FQR65_LT01527 [Abscondita terminalis]